MVSFMHLQICCMLDLTSKALLVELLVFIFSSNPNSRRFEKEVVNLFGWDVF